MSKGLKALENICNQCEHYQFEKGLRPKQCPFNKSCVFKQRIEKELKALEIIRELVGSYDIQDLPDSWFDLLRTWLNRVLSEEKIDLLREVLG